MAQTFFFLMVFGFPATVLLVALLAGHVHSGDVLDWKPARPPQREARLRVVEIDQLLAAENRLRRLRGAPERSLEEVALHTASLELYVSTLPPADLT